MLMASTNWRNLNFQTTNTITWSFPIVSDEQSQLGVSNVQRQSSIFSHYEEHTRTLGEEVLRKEFYSTPHSEMKAVTAAKKVTHPQI